MRRSLIFTVSMLAACGGTRPDATKAQTEEAKAYPPAKTDPPTKATDPTPAATDPPTAVEQTPDLTWFCACYSEVSDAGPNEMMACHFAKADCLDLEREARTGAATIVADSLTMRCKRAFGHKPDNVGHSKDWRQPGPLARENHKGCLLPKDDLPVEPQPPPHESKPTPDPRPEKLEALAAEYRAVGPGDGDMEQQQARRWHKVDYKQQIIRAAEGDKRALAVILGLKLDASGAEIHSVNVETLLLGYGDEAFARVLATQPKDTIELVLGDLDWAIQLTEPTDPRHYRQTHPETFALESPPPESDPSKEPRAWWCTCTKPEGTTLSTLACHERAEACVAFEQAALAATPKSIEKACRLVSAPHPGDEFGGREAWRPLPGGGLQSTGECALRGRADVPARLRSSAPRPRLLTALAELYEAGEDTDPLPVQVRSWYRLEYRDLVAKATASDQEAVGTLVGLDLEGGVLDIHASTVDSLMRGYGDARFAEILATLPTEARQQALQTLDYLERGALSSTTHYRHVYSRTFAAGEHLSFRDW